MVDVKFYAGGSLEQREVDTAPFGAKVLYRTLKDAVVMHLANQRQGTAKVKGRSEIQGSNKKPYRQKHTGRAGAGDRASPIWRGGGTVFGPQPRDYSYHMPSKARRVALRSAMLGKLQDGEVMLVELPGFEAPSARTAREVLSGCGISGRALLVIAEHDTMLWKSFRNFPGVSVRTAAELCTHDVVCGGQILIEPPALEQLQARVGLAPPEATDGAAPEAGVEATEGEGEA